MQTYVSGKVMKKHLLRYTITYVVIYPISKPIIDSEKGWLYLFGLLFGLTAVLSLPAAPGTIEGFIYTDVSAVAHFVGMPEILVQSLLISFLYWLWQRKGRKNDG